MAMKKKAPAKAAPKKKGDEPVRAGVGKKKVVKSGAGYKKGLEAVTRRGDLAGRGPLNQTDDPFGSYIFSETGRTNKRYTDQLARRAAKPQNQKRK